MQALIADTRNCADLSKVLDKLGTVEEGKMADLIVVADSPLDHISNLRKLEMVFKDGKPVNLKKMKVRPVSGSSTLNSMKIYI